MSDHVETQRTPVGMSYELAQALRELASSLANAHEGRGRKMGVIREKTSFNLKRSFLGAVRELEGEAGT